MELYIIFFIIGFASALLITKNKHKEGKQQNHCANQNNNIILKTLFVYPKTYNGGY